MRIAFVTLCILLLTFSTQALPKFASRLNLSCQSCHINPTGGGLRNAFGATSYGPEELPIPTWQEEFALEEFSTQLNDFISVGADFRTLFFSQDAGNTSRVSFFQMQSDLYMSARIAKRTFVYLNKGIGSRFEAFGLAGILPMNGYVKAGWFVPNSGLRMDDHNIVTRDKTLFPFGGGHDAGIEVAMSPGIFTLTASITNGTLADRDDNKLKAILGRAETRFGFAGMNFHVGGSYYNNAGSGGVTSILAAFGTMSIANNLTVLAEVDQKRVFSGGVKTLSSIWFVEADYVVTQGIDLKAGVDFYDPDTRFTTGTQSRIFFGFELFPISGLELRPLYVINKEEPTDSKNNQILVLLHFFL